MREVLLIRRAVRGSREALEELVRLYYEKIYNYIFYRVMNESQAEDLTQDVFMKLTRTIHTYVPTASFSSFLYRIAHNTVIDHYRTMKHTEELQEIISEEDSMAQIEVKTDIEMVLSKVSEEQRECIILYYLQELSYREISIILGIPIPTAKSALPENNPIVNPIPNPTAKASVQDFSTIFVRSSLLR